ncbi:hypothetical protein [Spiroplasma endosymbiont of Virgichneumon dumeticola]|uniref:hypothetical protein n=1 Tax=Spiroplasma endosymbiont of Virgichneumon dumeticola TaxID=3139323 RepID=UPI0035C88D52
MLNNDLSQVVVNNESTPLLEGNSSALNTEIRNWTNTTIMRDLKKLGIGIGYLASVVVLKTGQRAFTVMISSEDEIDWNKLLKTINPAEDMLEFVLTIPQLGISVLAMDAWKWGFTNIIKTIKSELNTEINSEETTVPESTIKSFAKLVFAKLGYWVPNHFMITASSMYSVKNLASFQVYIDKIISGLNIASTFIRAEVLGFTSDFLRKAITSFGEISVVKCCNEKISKLLEKLKFLDMAEDMNQESKAKHIMKISLKIVLYSIAMLSATFTDNAIKTALVMYTADKLDQFLPTFFAPEMITIMIGLICVDTFGNKFCNPIAKDSIKIVWNKIKESFAKEQNINNNNNNGDDGGDEFPSDIVNSQSTTNNTMQNSSTSVPRSL